jgi:hypothetical protein
MEGSVLSFLRAEWKVSDTGSAQCWASSIKTSELYNYADDNTLCYYQNGMSNLYRGPSIDAYYQVSYHLAKWFQRKRCFRNRTIRNKNCLWRPCLLTDQNGMSNLYRGPSIDASVYFKKCSPMKPHGQMIRNLVGSIYGKSSYKDCSFCPNLLRNMATTDNSCLWLVDLETRIACGGLVC